MFGNKWIDRIDNIGVWLLLFLVLLFIFTGYGMTKNIIDPALAKYIHSHLLPIPLYALFLIHILKPVRNQFKSWKIFKEDKALDIYIYALALILMVIFLWLYFR